MRAEGEIPAVIYGHGEAPVSVQVPQIGLRDAIRRRARMFEFDIGGKKDTVLLKAVQYDAFGSDLVHADFVRIAMDEAITLVVPVQLKGTPKAEHAVLQQTLPTVEIQCLPKDIPDAIIAMVAELQVGQTFHVREMTPPAGVKILTDGELIVATLTTIMEEVAAPAAGAAEGEGGAEPEVIGRKAGEEGEEAEADDKKK
jgi:large subunit ribosomal protein L25